MTVEELENVTESDLQNFDPQGENFKEAQAFLYDPGYRTFLMEKEARELERRLPPKPAAVAPVPVAGLATELYVQKILRILVKAIKEHHGARIGKLEERASEFASASRVSELLAKVETLDKRNALLDARLRDCEKGCEAHRRHLQTLEGKIGKLASGGD